MPNMLVIADDLTGAAEIAGIAKLAGFSAKIVLGKPESQQFNEDVLVIDSHTRNDSPGEAGAKLKNILAGISIGQFAFVFKKTDSVLRGPVATEISTLMKFTGQTHALLVPANPSNARTIINGHYYIDGTSINETSFKNDPHYPRYDPFVESMIVDNQGMVKYMENPFQNEEVNASKILIPPVQSEKELVSWVNNISVKSWLMAGGADFFRQLLMAKFNCSISSHSTLDSLNTSTLNQLFIWGSHPDNWRKNMEDFKKNGYSIFHFPDNLILEDNSSKKWNKWRQQMISGAIGNSGMVLTSPLHNFNTQAQFNRITHYIAETTSELLEKFSPHMQLYIEGGETAFVIFKKLQWKEFWVKDVLGYGVVAVQSVDSFSKIVIKPGSYAWPSVILPQNPPDL